MPAGDIYGGGSPTGVAFYENGALGEKFQGLLLACEAGKNVIFGYYPKLDGADWKLERFDFFTSNKEHEFAGSDFLGGKSNEELKTKFRPSDVVVGPDGALYVADWFDSRVGGHQTLDDQSYGTIYRIAPKGFKSQVPKIDLQTTEGQITALKSPANNVRWSGFSALKAQGEKVVPAVAPILKDPNPFVAARAIWLLAQLGETGRQHVVSLLQSENPSERLVAYRALRHAGQDILPLARKMSSDASAAVRREVALSLRNVATAQAVPILVEIGRRFDGKDRAYLEAFGLASEGRESAVYAALEKSMVNGKPEEVSEAFAGLLWRLHPSEAVPSILAKLRSDQTSPDLRKKLITALGFVESPSASEAMLELASKASAPTKDSAVWWLLHNNQHRWAEHGLAPKLKASGVYDPDKIQLVASEPPPVPHAPSLPSPAEIAAIPGDPVRGKAAGSVCFMCHRIGETGVEFGPDLTAFASQQTKEVIAQAIAMPSADIAHGFEGSILKTKEGQVIYGMVVGSGDPVLIQSVGGIQQMVPKSKIASLSPMKNQSLMYEPAQLGLDAQKIADIVAWLKSSSKH